LVEERAEGAWINLHDMLVPLPLSRHDASGNAGFRFIWASERSGYRQLYLYQYPPIKYLNSEGATCLLDGQPIGGGGPWIVER